MFKAIHMVSIHYRRVGGTTRDRLKLFTDASIESINENGSSLYIKSLKWAFRLRLWIFERLFWLYSLIYGFKEYKVPDLEKYDEGLSNSNM